MVGSARGRTLLDAINETREQVKSAGAPAPREPGPPGPALGAPPEIPAPVAAAWAATAPAPLPHTPPSATLEPEPERQAVYWRISDWLYERWDFANEECTVAVYGVCEGGAMVWETWLALAPLETLRRGLALIEQEDAYLGEQSPWRRPKRPLESYGERVGEAFEHAIAEGSERHPLLGESEPRAYAARELLPEGDEMRLL